MGHAVHAVVVGRGERIGAIDFGKRHVLGAAGADRRLDLCQRGAPTKRKDSGFQLHEEAPRRDVEGATAAEKRTGIAVLEHLKSRAAKWDEWKHACRGEHSPRDRHPDGRRRRWRVRDRAGRWRW